jgi:hypothetical protein
LQALQSETARARQLLTDAEKKLVQLAGQTSRAREQRERQEQQLQQLGRQLELQRQELADIEQDSRQKQQDLGELRERLLNTRQQLDHSRKEIETLKHPPRQQAVRPVIEKPAAAAPEPTAVAEKQGFSLRFDSAEALDRLVAAGSVTLYAMANQQAWRLSMHTGRPAAAQASFPAWFHEMSAATVPAHYLHGLENAAPNPGQSAVVWGVQLPAATRAAIATLTRGRQGGALLIRGDGRVILEE